MEVAETKENCLDFGVFIVNVVSVEEDESSLQVLFQTLWRLIGQLDGSFKQANWN